jgi:hypothetical protein
MKHCIAALMALALTACATPSEVINEGPTDLYRSSAGVADTTGCVVRASQEITSSVRVVERASELAGVREVVVSGDYGTMMVARIAPAGAGSTVTVYYSGSSMRAVHGGKMTNGCAVPVNP